MINVTVINIKSMVKYLVWVIILAVGITCTRFFMSEENSSKLLEQVANISFTSCISETLPDLEGKSKISQLEEKKTTSRGSTLKRMLQVEIPMIDTLIEDGEEEKVAENTQIVENAKTDVTTTPIQENNITGKYNLTYGSVKIKNESSKEITQDMLIPNISLEDKKDLLIFHTHTCESYTPTEAFNYEMTGSYRTTNLDFSVARVGSELKKQLDSYGYQVTHDQTYHDYPAYTGSYNRSMATVENILKGKPETQMVIDLHRDAVGSSPNYAPSVKIGEEVAAQMMFVIGSDGGGLQHLNWQQNLKFAVKVQEKANELYPGLFRPIIVRNSRYNQHLAKAATIIEVGATGNTMEQCLVSMKYLAKVIDEALK